MDTHSSWPDKAMLANMLNDSSIDRVMAIDAQWRIIAWNQTSEILSGRSKKEVIGNSLLEIFPQLQEDEEMMQAIRMAFTGMKTFVPSHEHFFNRKHYENHFIPLLDGNRIAGVMNIMHDVAHRIKAEQELKKLNIALDNKYHQLTMASDEMYTFTYVTTHNIKKPLRQVYSSLELLVRAEAKALSDGGKANLRRIQASLNRMNLLLDDILAVSRINTFMQAEKWVNLNNIVLQSRESLRSKIEEKGAIIEAADLPDIPGYEDMLQLLFTNLLDNAMKFQQPGKIPVITIRHALVVLNEKKEEDAGGREFHKITVEDNGIGFAQEEVEKLFTMFEKLHQKTYAGSGVGLAACKKIMNVHEGFIGAEGFPGIGARFYCCFPVQKEG